MPEKKTAKEVARLIHNATIGKQYPGAVVPAEEGRPIDLEAALRLADEAERVAAEANPGPWTYDPPRGPCDPMGHCIVSAAGYAVAVMMMTSDLDDHLKEQASKNGPFIAHARTSVPALASAVRGLVERVRELERLLEKYGGHIGEECDQRTYRECSCGWSQVLIPLLTSRRKSEEPTNA